MAQRPARDWGAHPRPELSDLLGEGGTPLGRRVLPAPWDAPVSPPYPEGGLASSGGPPGPHCGLWPQCKAPPGAARQGPGILLAAASAGARDIQVCKRHISLRKILGALLNLVPSGPSPVGPTSLGGGRKPGRTQNLLPRLGLVESLFCISESDVAFRWQDVLSPWGVGGKQEESSFHLIYHLGIVLSLEPLRSASLQCGPMVPCQQERASCGMGAVISPSEKRCAPSSRSHQCAWGPMEAMLGRRGP